MTIENKPASAYAKNGTSVADAKSAVTKPGNGLDKANISVGNVSKGNYSPENKYGKIMMRGTGAATKGKMSSGKMG